MRNLINDPARQEAIESALEDMRRDGGDLELTACVGPPHCTNGTPRCPFCEVFYLDTDGKVSKRSGPILT